MWLQKSILRTCFVLLLRDKKLVIIFIRLPSKILAYVTQFHHLSFVSLFRPVVSEGLGCSWHRPFTRETSEKRQISSRLCPLHETKEHKKETEEGEENMSISIHILVILRLSKKHVDLHASLHTINFC